MLGTVKWFSKDKGYGFITSKDGVDHYVHGQSVQGVARLAKGDSVNFESAPGKKSPRAINVAIINKAANHGSGRSSTEDRIDCPSCNKKIVPRLIIANSEPVKSVCPYCAALVKEFEKKWCFIATAVYGDTDCNEVTTLRQFRDRYLLPNTAGKIFVDFYYKISPPIAVWLTKNPKLSKLIKPCLDFVVRGVGLWQKK